MQYRLAKLAAAVTFVQPMTGGTVWPGAVRLAHDQREAA
jgi:hypothetical protein